MNKAGSIVLRGLKILLLIQLGYLVIVNLALQIPLGGHSFSDVSSLSPDEEVSILQASSIGRFVLEACIGMAVVYQHMTNCRRAMDTLSSYFGEESFVLNGLFHRGLLFSEK